MKDRTIFKRNKEKPKEQLDNQADIEALMEQFKNEQTLFKNQLAHSIRMPLAVISGYGDLIKKGQYNSEEVLREYLEMITQNISYLNIAFQLALTEDKYIKPTNYEMIDLLEIIKDVAKYSERYLNKKEIRIEVNCSRETIPIYGGKPDIIRIIYNLIENSYKYMDKGGCIYITVDKNASDTIVIFRDDGGKNPTNIGVQGNGYGHNMINEIMRLHGGTMEARSTAAGYSVFLTFKS